MPFSVSVIIEVATTIALSTMTSATSPCNSEKLGARYYWKIGYIIAGILCSSDCSMPTILRTPQVGERAGKSLEARDKEPEKGVPAEGRATVQPAALEKCQICHNESQRRHRLHTIEQRKSRTKPGTRSRISVNASSGSSRERKYGIYL